MERATCRYGSGRAACTSQHVEPFLRCRTMRGGRLLYAPTSRHLHHPTYAFSQNRSNPLRCVERWTIRSPSQRRDYATARSASRSSYTDVSTSSSSSSSARVRRRRASSRDDDDGDLARRRSSAEANEDPWANTEITEVRIVYDPYHSSTSSSPGSMEAYVSALAPRAADGSVAADGSLRSAEADASRRAYDGSGRADESVRARHYDPYQRVSTADKWKSSSSSASSSSLSSSAPSPSPPYSAPYASPAGGAAAAPAPFPRPFLSSPSSDAGSSATSATTAEATSAEATASESGKSSFWRIVAILTLMGLQMWDMNRSVNKAKEEAQRKKEEERAKRTQAFNEIGKSEASSAATSSAANVAGAESMTKPPDSTAVAAPPPAEATPATNGQSSRSSDTNSLAVWVSRQKRLNHARLLQRKLERGLTKNERDAVLKMCVQSTIDVKQAREILALPTNASSANEQKEGAAAVVKKEDPSRGVLVRKVLADMLGPEVQVREYAIVNTTMQSNTTDATVWIQESRQVLQSRTDPSRRVVMDIRTRIVEMKEKQDIKSEEEGLILVENRRDLLQEVLSLMRRPTEQEGDSRVATYVDKVDMTFGPSVCLEFEFDNVRIS